MNARITQNPNTYQDTRPGNKVYSIVIKLIDKPLGQGYDFVYVETDLGPLRASEIGLRWSCRGYPDVDAAVELHYVRRCTEYESWETFRAWLDAGLIRVQASRRVAEQESAKVLASISKSQARQKITDGRRDAALEFLRNL